MRLPIMPKAMNPNFIFVGSLLTNYGCPLSARSISATS